MLVSEREEVGETAFAKLIIMAGGVERSRCGICALNSIERHYSISPPTPLLFLFPSPFFWGTTGSRGMVYSDRGRFMVM